MTQTQNSLNNSQLTEVGIKGLENNQDACLDDMLCERIKHFGSKTLYAVVEIKNNCHPQAQKLLIFSKKGYGRISLRLNPCVKDHIKLCK